MKPSASLNIILRKIGVSCSFSFNYFPRTPQKKTLLSKKNWLAHIMRMVEFKIVMCLLFIVGASLSGWRFVVNAINDHKDAYIGPHGLVTVPPGRRIPTAYSFYVDQINGQNYVIVDPSTYGPNDLCYAVMSPVHIYDDNSLKNLPRNLAGVLRDGKFALCVMCLNLDQQEDIRFNNGKPYIPGGYRMSDLGLNTTVLLPSQNDQSRFQCKYRSDRYPASYNGQRYGWIVLMIICVCVSYAFYVSVRNHQRNRMYVNFPRWFKSLYHEVQEGQL